MPAPRHPFEAERLAALQRLGLIPEDGDRPIEAQPGLDALADCAARLTGAPVALVTLLGADVQWVLARTGIDLSRSPREHAFCAHAILGDALMEVSDLRADPRFKDNPFVTGVPHVRFYAGQPLAVDGQNVGTLCLLDTEPRQLSPRDRHTLAQLGRAAVELLQSRQRLRDAEGQRERLLDFGRAAGDWMWETDAEDRYTWLSAAVEAATGIAAESLIGQPICDAVLLDERGAPLPSGVTLRQLMTRRAAFARAISRARTPRGELVLSHSAVPVFDAKGRFAGYRGTVRDISERVATEGALRAHEERWQMAAAAAGIGIASLNLADGKVALDERACINHGLVHPQPDFTLGDWLAQIDPADREAASAGVQRAVTSGAPFEGRYRIHRPDGSMRWLEFVVRALRNDGGQPIGVIGICRDVHEQQVATELRRSTAEAERASRAKSEFLSRVSHELRTPLNGILGFAQLMALDREQPLAGTQARRLASVQRAGRHLLDLINDVLELTRIEREGFELEQGPVDVDAALRASLALVQPLAQDRGIALELPPRSGAWARGDTRAIEQVLMNLLSNAVKYSGTGARVHVAVAHAGAELAIAVRDEGAGLSAAQQERLFQPFDRLGADRQQVEGSGLGLVIARQLAEAMGGRIAVSSAPGAGSTFTLWLPASELAGVADDSAPGALDAAMPAPAVRQPPRRVLYVEDEALNQVLLQEVFRARPAWALEIASDGAQGLTRARELAPDLMLIDMNLPDTTGLALIRRLRADPTTRALRCIALSADAMVEQIDAARGAGFDDYWTKPIDVSKVLVALDALLA